MEHKIRITLEPMLERKVALMTVRERKQLARLYFRWAKQLYVSVRIIEMDQEPTPKRSLKMLAQRKLKMN